MFIYAIIMAISGELICLWYSPSIIDVKFSLLFLKFDTRIGDILVRTHKLIIAISFVAVILHLGKAVFFSSMFGVRSSTWKTGFGVLLIMFASSYAGCILPWTVLSPTLFTMVQTIVDTYIGGWAVFVILGGELTYMSILSKVLIAHILVGVVGAIFLIGHVRAVHFVISSVNRFYIWVTLDRPLWLPNELVKELYLLYAFFFFFLSMVYRKSASFGSSYSSLYKFYYGGATNWNNLPASIEPEWYFWLFYFALASASSLLGGLLRIFLFFILLGLTSVFKNIQCYKTVETTEEVSSNTGILFSFIGLFFIFFNRSRSSFWHIYFLDSVLFFLILGDLILSSSNNEIIKKIKKTTILAVV